MILIPVDFSGANEHPVFSAIVVAALVVVVVAVVIHSLMD